MKEKKKLNGERQVVQITRQTSKAVVIGKYPMTSPAPRAPFVLFYLVRPPSISIV